MFLINMIMILSLLQFLLLGLIGLAKHIFLVKKALLFICQESKKVPSGLIGTESNTTQ